MNLGASPARVAAALIWTATTIAGSAPAASLVEVPHPDLSGAEPFVREQLRSARATLDDDLLRSTTTSERLAASFGRLGMLYHAYDLWDAAAACYRNAESLAPTELRWPYYLGHIHRERGEPVPAIEAFARALAVRADHVPSLVQLAGLRLDDNDQAAARELFERALAQDADCAPAHVGLARIAYGDGDHEMSVRHLQAARKTVPDATEIYYRLGLAYRGLGDREQAAAFLSRSGTMEVEPSDPLIDELRALEQGTRHHEELGKDHFAAGRYREALAEFRKAVAASPDEPRLRVTLGDALSRLGDHEGARQEFETAVRLDPGYANAHYNLGVALVGLGRDEAALEHYASALDSDPEMTSARFNMANALRRLGRFEQAAEEYGEVVRRDPSHAAAWLSRSLTLMRLHRWRDARAELERALQALPDALDLRHALVRLLASAPDDDVRDGGLAGRLAGPLVLDPMPFDHRVTLAMVAAENGDFEGAVRLQTRAIGLAAQGGAPQALRRELDENLARYRRREGCRRPWPDDDPTLSP